MGLFDGFCDQLLKGWHLKESIVRKTEIVAIGCQKDMVEDLHIEQLCPFLDFSRQVFVGLTWSHLTGRMVMCQDHRDRERFQCNGKKDPHVHQCPRNPSMGKGVDAFYLIGLVEQHDFEGLMQTYGALVPILEEYLCRLVGTVDR